MDSKVDHICSGKLFTFILNILRETVSIETVSIVTALQGQRIWKVSARKLFVPDFI